LSESLATHAGQHDIPHHVAIIMDGNGRWAKKHDLPRLMGHSHGVESVRRALEFCIKSGIDILSVYAFSSENWARPKEEVDGLMALFAEQLVAEKQTFLKEGIRLVAIGDRSRLPEGVIEKLIDCESATAQCGKLTFIMAVSYGGRDELVRAAKKLVSQVKLGIINTNEISEDSFESFLDTAGFPDPDLLIRTSGESRISNFMLWQLAYTEIVVSPVLWPDFDEKEFARCLAEYAQRNRRFGLTENCTIGKVNELSISDIQT
jgi:undecaprenyl diphosphate synthase